jgi:hypothetical protein
VSANGARWQVQVEVSGCLTTCAHCWARGGAYGSMPFDDAAFVLDELARFCGERDVPYLAYPMHEVTAHPQAPDLIRLFTPHLGGRYDPILTPGAPLASRPDWAEVVSAAKECGAEAIWVALHGFGEEHDRQLRRPGAFAETCLAVERAREAGLGTGANVFLTKTGLATVDRLLAVLAELRLGNWDIGPAGFRPHARGRRYEAARIELEDALAVAERVSAVLGREWWPDVRSCTEAAWVRRSRDGDLPAEGWWAEPQRWLVVRPNLDAHTGLAGLYRRRHGNLRRDGARRVLERAFADPPVEHEALWFPDGGPSTAELASRWGDPNGTRVHVHHTELRWLWLDRAAGRAA